MERRSCKTLLFALTVALLAPASGYETAPSGNQVAQTPVEDHEPFLQSSALRLGSPYPALGTLKNLAGNYSSLYKSTSSCPDTVVIGRNVPINANNTVSEVQVGEIVEDGRNCSGGTFVSATTPFAISDFGKKYLIQRGSNITARLQHNVNANFNWSLLGDSRVGFDDYSWTTNKVRRCGPSTYDRNTFWFSIEGGSTLALWLGSTHETSKPYHLEFGTKSLLVSERLGNDTRIKFPRLVRSLGENQLVQKAFDTMH